MTNVSTDYFKYQKQYEDTYGEKTVILYQLGQFYEVYAYYDDQNNIIGKAREIGPLINFVVSRKNKKLDISFSNPIQVGINIATFDKSLRILMENQWTVVIVSQKPQSETSKYIEREVTHIYSPGTYIEETSLNTYIGCIYVSKSKNWAIGVSLCDMSTGEIHVYYADSCEELCRITESYKPKEVVLLNESGDDNIKDYINQTLISEKQVGMFKNINYQTEVFAKVYKSQSLLTYHEQFDIERYPEISVSLAYLLQFCYEHNSKYTEKLQYPVFGTTNGLVIHNNALSQLNVIDCKKSLFEIVESVFR